MQFTAIALVSSAAFDGLNVWLDLRCRTKNKMQLSTLLLNGLRLFTNSIKRKSWN